MISQDSVHWSDARAGRAGDSSEFMDRLGQARQGCSVALGEILEKTRIYLLTVADQRLGSGLQGKVGRSDVVQETFVHAQQDFSRFEGSSERELLAWLAAILTHRVANVARHHQLVKKRSVWREVPADAAELMLQTTAAGQATPGTNLIAAEEERLLQVALTQLPATVREVLLLRIWHRVSFAEMGAALGCTPEAARKRFLRAVEELQTIMHVAQT